MIRDALISPDGKYRYRLSRDWDESLPKVMFVMLNPSKADAVQDDQTLRRCIGFAKLWGYGGLRVGNLFAWRATDPGELEDRFAWSEDIIGPDNDSHLLDMASGCGRIVFAWGNDGNLCGRAAVIGDLFKEAWCLGKTKLGFPKHPCRLSKNLFPIPF